MQLLADLGAGLHQGGAIVRAGAFRFGQLVVHHLPRQGRGQRLAPALLALVAGPLDLVAHRLFLGRAKSVLLTAFLLMSPIAYCDSSDPFTVESIKESNEFRIVAKNTSRAPMDATIALSVFDNIASDESWPIHRVVKAGQTLDLARIRAHDPSRPFSFTYQTTAHFGDPNAQPDPHATYRLPFKDGSSFVIGQAPGGPLTTHNSPDARFAVDIPMPVGTTIVAARSGYVVENVRLFDVGKLEPYFLDKANYVRILHDDGTWADYAHLTRYSANLYPGTHIDAGTPIGLSGSSGYSSGPHLHFVVQKNDAGRIVSIPFRFYTVAQGVFSPGPNQSVTADYKLPHKDAAGMRAVNTRPDVKRTVRDCMAGGNVIDESVMGCMGAR